MRDSVEKMVSFISCSGLPWILKSLPVELAREIRPLMVDIKERCNEWLDKRGVFSNDRH